MKAISIDWKVILKYSFLFATSIPAFMALLEITLFGISLNQWIIRPIVRPKVSCTSQYKYQEGNRSRIYEVVALIENPLYLDVLPTKTSIPFRLTVDVNNGVSFSNANIIDENKVPIYFETQGSQSKEAEKALHVNVRFIDNSKLKFTAKFSSSLPIGEEECPFSYDAQYWYL